MIVVCTHIYTYILDIPPVAGNFTCDCIFFLFFFFFFFILFFNAFFRRTHISIHSIRSHWPQKFVFSMKNDKRRNSKQHCNNINFNYNNRERYTNVYKYIIKAISFLKRQCTHRKSYAKIGKNVTNDNNRSSVSLEQHQQQQPLQ